MKVQILQDGTFSKFNIPGLRHRIGKQQLATGTVIEYPDWYAESIVEDGLAVPYAEPEAPQVAQAVLSATGPASRLAAELGIDLFTVTGSGKDGRITAGDVRKAAQ